jgi:hypothetical protein
MARLLRRQVWLAGQVGGVVVIVVSSRCGAGPGVRVWRGTGLGWLR